ncbi:MAG: methyltransferase [Clostridia bacterium]|nr:methyltransferase [Clostridia bacterium]
MNVKLEPHERIEDLQCKGLKIIQNRDYYTFTSDSVILANFIKMKKGDKGADIGTGCGIIPVLLSAKVEFEKISAFEIQPQMARIAEKNVILNKLEDKIEIVSDDVRNFKQHFKAESFDVVFSNPPYMHSNVALNEKPVRAIARHDNKLPIDDLCKTAYDMLKFNGKFYVVYTSTRTAELICTLKKFNLEPKRMFFTENGKDRVVLVVIEAVKGAKQGMEVLPALQTNDKNGDYLKILQTRYFGR